MHSSRMRIGCSLSVSGGGVYLVRGGVPGPGGVPGLRGVPSLGGVPGPGYLTRYPPPEPDQVHPPVWTDRPRGGGGACSKTLRCRSVNAGTEDLGKHSGFL